MACKLSRMRIQKRMVFRRKLRILRNLTHSNSMKTTSIIMDAFLYISALKLKLQALKREKMNLIKHKDQLPLLEVNAEKLDKRRFHLRVTSKKGRDNLVYILEAFEEIGIGVVHAKVAGNGQFIMEAIVEVSQAKDESNNNADDHQGMDPSVLSAVVVKAIERSSGSSC
ncbi:hypothetical protein Cgig2_029392 [Carnegiea gigantea]|uniref:Plant bHLH transcription factor ACT-like domain-containing protein n=1 Tax=Carnegiea gigantea TaxID=171969 RepID=A0A9Q1QRV9_9CARY|nr:hypothetical protein Cgig2_029392 [Carnegiea gigantea]